METLETKTQGPINAGYFGSYQELITFGNLAFNTNDFCAVVGKFARDSSLEQSCITSYQGSQPLSDPVLLLSNGDTMVVGDYIIPAKEFARFSYYVAKGGLFGWGGTPPDHAEFTVEAMKESDHLLFAPYKGMYRELDTFFDQIREIPQNI